jgi:hypothetical protein
LGLPKQFNCARAVDDGARGLNVTTVVFANRIPWGNVHDLFTTPAESVVFYISHSRANRASRQTSSLAENEQDDAIARTQLVRGSRAVSSVVVCAVNAGSWVLSAIWHLQARYES